MIYDKGGKRSEAIYVFLWQGGKGVGKFLILADKGGGEGSIWAPQFFTYIICEQPLNEKLKKLYFFNYII